jgi:hypothetical protein
MSAAGALPVMVYAFSVRDVYGDTKVQPQRATIATILLLRGLPIPETGLEVTVNDLDHNGFYTGATVRNSTAGTHHANPGL